MSTQQATGVVKIKPGDLDCFRRHAGKSMRSIVNQISVAAALLEVAPADLIEKATARASQAAEEPTGKRRGRRPAAPTT